MRKDSTDNKYNTKKIALVHDYLYTYGGAERVFQVIVNSFPNADIYTSYYLKDKLPEFWQKRKINEGFLGKIPILKETFLRKYFTFPNFLSIYLLNLSKYDLIISSSSGPAKILRFNKNAKHISYIHTPHWEAWGIKNSKSILKKLIKPLLRYLEYYSSAKPTILLANSKTTQERIKKFYKRESTILFPPVEVKKIKKQLNNSGFQKEDYFVMVSRLDFYKGVSIVAKILDKAGYKMKIIGKGEDEINLKDLSSNIDYLGWVDDERKIETMAKAKAFIMWNIEDFGITMVESIASGTPVIAFKKGGALDIIREGINGIFFEKQTEKSLLEAIRKIEKMKFDYTKLKSTVEKFSKEEFVKKLNRIIENA